jgi:hypothetical protein
VFAPLPEDRLELVNRWSACRSWPEEGAFLREHRDALAEPAFESALAVLGELYPGDATIERRQALLREMRERGCDIVVEELAALHDSARVATAWIATRTWRESRDFLIENRERLLSGRTEAWLQGGLAGAEAVARQHLSILRLCRTAGVDEAYELVTDSTLAAERALAHLEAGDGEGLGLVLAANPSVSRLPFHGSLLVASLGLLLGQAEDVRGAVTRAAAEASDVQRRVAAIRFRKLAATRPDLATATEGLVAALNAAPDDPAGS